MTDDDIEMDYLVDAEFEKEIDDYLKTQQPYCQECKYIGEPYPQTGLCPKCGSGMKIPGKTYGDDLEEDLKAIGVDPENIKTPT